MRKATPPPDYELDDVDHVLAVTLICGRIKNGILPSQETMEILKRLQHFMRDLDINTALCRRIKQDVDRMTGNDRPKGWR